MVRLHLDYFAQFYSLAEVGGNLKVSTTFQIYDKADINWGL